MLRMDLIDEIIILFTQLNFCFRRWNYELSDVYFGKAGLFVVYHEGITISFTRSRIVFIQNAIH